MNPPRTLERTLQQRDRLRFAAVVLWSAFLGAVFAFLIWLALAVGAPDADLARISQFFLIAWAVALVPAACAAVLSHGR